MKYILEPVKKIHDLLYYKKPNSNTYSVISIKNGVVGDFSVAERNDLYIERLFIKKNFRQKGLGSKILNFIKILSKKENMNGKMRVFSSLIEDSKVPPHIFYRKYGFTSDDKTALSEIDKCIKEKKELPEYYKPIYMYI